MVKVRRDGSFGGGVALSAESRNVGSRWKRGSLVDNVPTDADGELRPKPEKKGLIVVSAAKKNLICVFSAGVDVSFTAEALRG